MSSTCRSVMANVTIVVTATEVLALHLDRAAFERVHAEHAYFRALVGEAMLRKTA